MPASFQSQGCPYAAALKQKQQEEHYQQQATKESQSTGLNHSNNSNDNVDQSLVAELKELELAKARCPAFSSMSSSTTEPSLSSCPFSQAKTAEEIKETFLQLPPSHLEPQGLVYKSLEHFHSQRGPMGSGSGGSPIFPGGCPVKNSILLRDSSTGTTISFHQAMEDYSLAAIMGRMAQEFESSSSSAAVDHHDDDASEDSSLSDHGHDNSEEQDIIPSTEKEPVSHSTDAASIGESSTASSVAVAAPPTTTTSTIVQSSSNVRPSLSEALKSGTAVSHEQAEHVHFVKNFIRGIIDRDLYSQLIVNLYHVYLTLEQELDTHAPTQFATCHFPKELYRTESLQDDVDFWYTTGSTTQVFPPPISPATQDYMDRIHYCATQKPLLLLSHAYTRYLGDLSGGKILARVARRALNLDKDGDGLAFYHFEHVVSAKKFKDLYRTALNDLQLSEEDITDLVHEANIAFGLNVRLFEELDVQGGVLGATVRPLDDVLHFEKLAMQKEGHHGSSPAAEVKECPFAVGKSTSAKATSSSSATMTKQHEGGVGGGRCPWPFVFLHDPATGFQCWQTWVVLGLLFSWMYNQYIS